MDAVAKKRISAFKSFKILFSPCPPNARLELRAEEDALFPDEARQKSVTDEGAVSSKPLLN